MQEDRQREIAAENHSLMQRLAGIMKAETGESAPKYAHLSVGYLESLRRKKLLKLEVSTWEMDFSSNVVGSRIYSSVQSSRLSSEIR